MEFKTKNRSAFTLIEVLVSILLFSATLSGAILGFSVGMRWAKNLSHRTTALGLAQAKMEIILKMPYWSIVPGTGEDFPLIDKGKIGTDEDNLGGVRGVVATQLSGHKEVKVTVAWYEFGNQYTEGLMSVVYP